MSSGCRVFTLSLEHLRQKALHARFSLTRHTDLNSLKPSLACKIFDSMISPILTYNSEVWGAFVKSDFKSWDSSAIEKNPFAIHGPVVRGRTVFAGGSWDARSNPRVATSVFFFLSSFFYPLAFYFLFSQLTLLASRDFCENVFLVYKYPTRHPTLLIELNSVNFP